MIDHNTELALLGIAMHKPAVTAEVDVTEGDFENPRAGAVWEIIGNLFSRGEPADPGTVLANIGQSSVRGIKGEWLAEVYGAAPLTSLADHHARIVLKGATARRLRLAFMKGSQALDEDVDPEEVVEMTRGWVDASSRSVAETHFVGDTLAETLDMLEAPEPDYTPTPWRDINERIGGLRKGSMYVIGARPGSGKTLMGLQLAVHMARTGHVAFSSLEMTKPELHQRILSQVTGIELGKFLDHRLTPADWEQIAASRHEVEALRLSIDDYSAANVTHVKSHACTVARRGPLAAIVVDYIGLMQTPPGDRRQRHEVVGDYSRRLKIMAKEMGVPVVVLAQLNRQGAGRSDSRPVLTDLRESGSLEQDSDVVMLLHRDVDETPHILGVHIAKNRQGMQDTKELEWDARHARLLDKTWTPTDAGRTP